MQVICKFAKKCKIKNVGNQPYCGHARKHDCNIDCKEKSQSRCFPNGYEKPSQLVWCVECK